tara:strand:- start:343 stop:1200 length:858 start_codon:yes stop_codon:yes gene_type:complete
MYPEIDKNKMKKGLYIVSTPIGNLGDISFRAIEILKNSDFILCEDTRVSKKILSKFTIRVNLISNHKFNEKSNVLKIINILKSNKLVSLISDAGTPAISDPGRIIVEECIKNKIDVFPIPGPSAVSTAISISGFSDRYYFHGFLPDKKSTISKDFDILSKLDCSIVFFISSKKINKIIDLLKKYFDKRNIVICKEITKYYEEYFRSSVKNLNKFEDNLKGEITVVISEKKEDIKKLINLDESDKKKIKKLMNKLSVRDIASLISEEKKISKKKIYNYCLKIKHEN